MATNEYWGNGFAWWQGYTQAYADFVVETTQKALEQSLALRQQLDQVVADALEKAQELSVQEQKMALVAVDAFQAQVQTAAKHFEKWLTAGTAN